MQCQFCRQKFHATCLTKQELSLLSFNSTFQCTECNLKLTQYLSYNYNRYPYSQIPNPRPMTVVPQQVLIAPKEQIPLNQIKNNNNKKNKNLSNKSKKQYKKNEEIVIEDDPEDNNQINEINQINNINTNVNQYNMIRNSNNNNMIIGNSPQIINSFYYINNNAQIAHMSRERERLTNSNDTSVNYNEEMSNNINSINNNSSMKNKKLKKSKPKKYNCIFNKNTLQILENMSITNEDKLLYILNNFRNIRIDPLIIKVLEDRKTKKRINIYESMLSEDQNTSSANEKERQIQNNKTEISASQNNYQSPQNDAGGVYTMPQPTKKIVFPIDDNILFSNLEKYKLSEDILDRPLPKKIELDFHMLNKLFIVWDFLITFKDIKI